ncbi:MAG: metallophosphoesterase [Bacteroidota bacterium]
MNRRLIRPFLVALLLTALVVSMMGVTLGQEVPFTEAPISCVHLTLGDDPMSMVVTWRSNLATGDAAVKAWPARLKAMPENGKELIVVKPNQHTYKYVRETVNIYDATLKGLEPNTGYNYLISCGGAASPVYSFQSPPSSADTPFSFAVMGDCRGDYRLFGKLIKMAREAGARFVVFTGDMTDSGTQPEWNLWFKGGAETLPYLPIMPLLGNHEMMTRCYFEQFLLPNPNAEEKNYYFTYGMAQFGVLYDGNEDQILQETIPWLKGKFAASPLPWKFIALHKPPYASVPYILETIRDGVAKAAEETGTAMVFSGHRHTYERTYPLIGGKPAENGVVYVVSGGAGAPLDETAGTDYTAKSAVANHFVMLNVTADKVFGTVKDASGNTIDEFAVIKRH